MKNNITACLSIFFGFIVIMLIYGQRIKNYDEYAPLLISVIIATVCTVIISPSFELEEDTQDD